MGEIVRHLASHILTHIENKSHISLYMVFSANLYENTTGTSHGFIFIRCNRLITGDLYQFITCYKLELNIGIVFSNLL